MTSSVALRPPPPPPPPPLRPSTCRILMPSIFSIGRTLSRTMPSIRSSSLRRNSDWRAASESTFSASLSSRCASASTAARTRSASAAMRVSSACFLGDQDLNRSAPARDLALADGGDALLRFRRTGPRVLGLRLRGRFFERLLVERDRLVHQRRLDDPLAIDFEPAEVAFAGDARLVEAALRGDTGALDLLVRGDLGFAQRLHAGDFELFESATTFEPRGLQDLLALDVASFRRSGARRSRPAAPAGRRRCARTAWTTSAMVRSSSATSIAFFCSMLRISRSFCEAMRSVSTASSTSIR